MNRPAPCHVRRPLPIWSRADFPATMVSTMRTPISTMRTPDLTHNTIARLETK